ncbi:MAG: hypothetical protein AAFV93_11385 [Chloroflexota bacterium]
MSRPEYQAIPKLYALTVVASAERTTTLQTDLPSVCFFTDNLSEKMQKSTLKTPSIMLDQFNFCGNYR